MIPKRIRTKVEFEIPVIHLLFGSFAYTLSDVAKVLIENVVTTYLLCYAKIITSYKLN